MCTSSPAAVDTLSQFLPDIVSLMHKFLHSTTPRQVHEAEVIAGYFGTTFKPYVNICYFDFTRHCNSSVAQDVPLVSDVYLTSVHAGLFGLQNMSLTDDFKDIVDKEGLHDYLTCLPWYTTDRLKDEATLLVQLVNEKIKPTPPRLVNILKGYLAINCGFTLDEVMSPSFINETLYQRLRM